MNGLKNNKKRWNDDLAQIPWNQFEVLLADHYKGKGYRVEHVGTGLTQAKYDGGIDLKLYKDDAYTIVQCKHWNAKQVPHNDIHQLIGLMVTENADAGIFITSGEYTAAARNAAAKHSKIELLDGVSLRKLLGEDVKLVRESRGSNYNSSPANDGLNQTVEYEPRRSVKHCRNKKLQVPLAYAIFIYALPLIFLILAVKSLPSFIGMVLKKPEPVPEKSQVISTATVISNLRPPVQKLETKHESASISSADGTMTPNELREWEKKNAESMRILERTVPELKD